MAKKKKNSSAPKPPSPALLSMLPPPLRAGLAELERERDDDSVTEDAWERHAMKLMHEANALPAPIRDAFGRAVKKIAALERYADAKAKAEAAKTEGEVKA